MQDVHPMVTFGNDLSPETLQTSNRNQAMPWPPMSKLWSRHVSISKSMVSPPGPCHRRSGDRNAAENETLRRRCDVSALSARLYAYGASLGNVAQVWRIIKDV